MALDSPEHSSGKKDAGKHVFHQCEHHEDGKNCLARFVQKNDKKWMQIWHNGTGQFMQLMNYDDEAAAKKFMTDICTRYAAGKLEKTDAEDAKRKFLSTEKKEMATMKRPAAAMRKPAATDTDKKKLKRDEPEKIEPAGKAKDHDSEDGKVSSEAADDSDDEASEAAGDDCEEASEHPEQEEEAEADPATSPREAAEASSSQPAAAPAVIALPAQQMARARRGLRKYFSSQLHRLCASA